MMSNKYPDLEDYSELSETLREYSRTHTGEIADLTYQAALAIDVLIGRVKIVSDTLAIS